VAEVVAVYLMALDPAVQAGGIDGVFENDWPIDGVSRKYVSKNLRDIISTPQIKAQYKKQLSALKSYYESQSSKEGRVAQIRLLDVLLEAAR
jgi:hypothetical protein